MKQHKIKVSCLWIPFLFLCVFLPVYKILFFIFLIMSIHEGAHVFVAYLFHYPIRKIILYPFGLCAIIESIGYRSGSKDLAILLAGPLTHLLEPLLLYLFVCTHVISYTFYEYLCMMNVSILIFNMLPIYPLDGGRIFELFLQLFFRYATASRVLNILSILELFLLGWFQILHGISAIMVILLLMMENVMACYTINYRKRVFYRYRRSHPVKYPVRMNKGHDLYRFSYNVMFVHGGWMEEEKWLSIFRL